MLRLQAVFAPLRWPMAVRIVRSTFGRDVLHEEARLDGRRVVLMQGRAAAGEWTARARLAAERGELPPTRPVVLFAAS